MGISNFEIERIFNKVDIRGLSKHFVGAFPSDKMNRFFLSKKNDEKKKISIFDCKYRQI